MSQDIENANVIITRLNIPKEGNQSFIDWQAKLQEVIAQFPDFLSLEILAPNEKQSHWTIIQRFTNTTSADSWKQSTQRKELFNQLQFIHKQNIEDFFSAENAFEGVTEVIVTEVDPKKKKFYRHWLSKIHQAEAKVPGFRGMYVQAPKEEKGRYWITFLQFNTAENLDKWLASTERQEILKELDPLIQAFESHRVISPYAGWFGSITKIGTIPSVWKQTMLVLLVLFPIVMLEFRFLNPWTKGLNISLGTFIGNAISVTLISFPMMPIVIFFFRWWLSPQTWNRTKTNMMGMFVLLVLYFLEVIFFWSFL